MARPNPLSDQVVIVALVVAIGLVFALVFWSVKLQPAGDDPLLWQQGPPPPERRGPARPQPLALL
jgi:hypothetical protein